MKEPKNKRQAEKDCYFPVIMSQLLCSVFLMCLFFFLLRGEGGQQITEKYSALLQEDFLTFELSEAVSGIKDYLLDGSSSLAVNGSRVEPYEQAPEEDEENLSVQSEAELTARSEATNSDVENETTDIALQTMSTAVKTDTVPLKLTYNKKQNMIAPVDDGVYTSYFGERTDPIVGGEDYHTGIDIAADEGSDIKAVFNGVVTLTGEDNRSGKYVFLEHESGIETLYCHCSEILVNEGESIEQGAVIALVGSTGYSTGPHLHFEVRMNEESIDPLPLLENAD